MGDRRSARSNLLSKMPPAMVRARRNILIVAEEIVGIVAILEPLQAGEILAVGELDTSLTLIRCHVIAVDTTAREGFQQCEGLLRPSAIPLVVLGIAPLLSS
jgi:hypothetical protein